jgi:hypothetical protein
MHHPMTYNMMYQSILITVMVPSGLTIALCMILGHFFLLLWDIQTQLAIEHLEYKGKQVP